MRDFTWQYYFSLTSQDTRDAVHNGPVSCVVFSRDGRLMATAGDDKFIRLRNAESGCIIRTLDANRAVGSLSFSPDGAVLASGGEELGVRLWDTRTGELLATLRRLRDLRPAGALAFSPDGKTLAVGGGPLLGLSLIHI